MTTEAICRNCGKPIYHSTYRDTPGSTPEPDYDPGADPVAWRHTGGYASCPTSFATPRPKIVVLCGSTRFKDVWAAENLRLTMEGNVVLSVGGFAHADAGGHAEEVWGEDVKQKLDALHKEKILIADEVLVLNVGGYIGSSTRSEIEFAHAVGKPVTYLEKEHANA